MQNEKNSIETKSLVPGLEEDGSFEDMMVIAFFFLLLVEKRIWHNEVWQGKGELLTISFVIVNLSVIKNSIPFVK